MSVGDVPLPYLNFISNDWEKVIAGGGFGSVYKGTDMDANIEVAIKVLRSDLTSKRDLADFEEATQVRNVSCWKRFPSIYGLTPILNSNYTETRKLEPSQYRSNLGKVLYGWQVVHGIGARSVHSILTLKVRRI